MAEILNFGQNPVGTKTCHKTPHDGPPRRALRAAQERYQEACNWQSPVFRGLAETTSGIIHRTREWIQRRRNPLPHIARLAIAQLQEDTTIIQSPAAQEDA